MREDHTDQIIRWANYVKNSNGKWKIAHTQFINAQFKKNHEFLERLSKQKGGREKIIRLYNIKNTEGYSKLLGY